MARKPSISKLLKHVPDGPVDASKEQISDLAKTAKTFARLVELGIRMKAAGLTAQEIFKCKPWQVPTVGTITEEQFEQVEAAIKAAE